MLVFFGGLDKLRLFVVICITQQLCIIMDALENALIELKNFLLPSPAKVQSPKMAHVVCCPHVLNWQRYCAQTYQFCQGNWLPWHLFVLESTINLCVLDKAMMLTR